MARVQTDRPLSLNRADGHCLIVCLAGPGTQDHDAVVLLDRTDLNVTGPAGGAAAAVRIRSRVPRG